MEAGGGVRDLVEEEGSFFSVSDQLGHNSHQQTVEDTLFEILESLLHSLIVKPGKIQFFLKNGKTVISIGNLEIF